MPVKPGTRATETICDLIGFFPVATKIDITLINHIIVMFNCMGALSLFISGVYICGCSKQILVNKIMYICEANCIWYTFI